MLVYASGFLGLYSVCCRNFGKFFLQSVYVRAYVGDACLINVVSVCGSGPTSFCGRLHCCLQCYVGVIDSQKAILCIVACFV